MEPLGASPGEYNIQNKHNGEEHYNIGCRKCCPKYGEVEESL